MNLLNKHVINKATSLFVLTFIITYFIGVALNLVLSLKITLTEVLQILAHLS